MIAPSEGTRTSATTTWTALVRSTAWVAMRGSPSLWVKTSDVYRRHISLKIVRPTASLDAEVF